MSSPRLPPQQQSEKEQFNSSTDHLLRERGLSSGGLKGPRGGSGWEALGGWDNVDTSSSAAPLAETVQLLGKHWRCRTGALDSQYLVSPSFSQRKTGGEGSGGGGGMRPLASTGSASTQWLVCH